MVRRVYECGSFKEHDEMKTRSTLNLMNYSPKYIHINMQCTPNNGNIHTNIKNYVIIIIIIIITANSCSDRSARLDDMREYRHRNLNVNCGRD